ncbi:hypothetical protein IMZ48_19245 [Candidatus Bathyarchaeota archaeon]|nr:hypothetical protein [Candidatus Bathyarchaeota archaeon]
MGLTNTPGRMLRKMDYRLLPTTAILYLLCYIDRSNIGRWSLLPENMAPL